MSIAENIAQVRTNIETACREAGRDPGEITLVGASKMNDAAACREAIAAGIDVLGENRVQEMTQKLGEHAYDGAPLHFIGHLQRNKVKQVVGHVDLIQSVGSIELLDEIEKVAAARDLVQDILLEVNIGREESKLGIDPDELFSVTEQIAELEHVRVRGLMAIPPKPQPNQEKTLYFDRMSKLFIDISAKKYDNITMDCLSMGMSADYCEAISCGATIVRLGTAIFGARHY